MIQLFIDQNIFLRDIGSSSTVPENTSEAVKVSCLVNDETFGLCPRVGAGCQGDQPVIRGWELSAPSPQMLGGEKAEGWEVESAND